MLVIRTLGPWILRTVHFRNLTGGNPIVGLCKIAWGQWFRRKSRQGNPKPRRPRTIVRVAVLPFEEQHSVDAARMESCKAVFAYEDTEDGKVKTIPACLWYPYRNERLEKISRKYGVAGGTSTPPAERMPGDGNTTVPKRPGETVRQG